jgi:hypothetical protein
MAFCRHETDRLGNRKGAALHAPLHKSAFHPSPVSVGEKIRIREQNRAFHGQVLRTAFPSNGDWCVFDDTVRPPSGDRDRFIDDRSHDSCDKLDIHDIGFTDVALGQTPNTPEMRILNGKVLQHTIGPDE